MLPEKLNMTEAESMQLIASMINKAKNRFTETGFLYLLWGWAILLCCVVQFIAYYFFNFQQAYYIWFITWIVLIYQIFFLRSKRTKKKVITYTDEINRFVWLTFFICMMLLIFILLQFKMYAAVNPAILVMYGMPTFLSGIILKFKALSIGGIFCWFFAILSPFVDPKFQLILISCSIILAWIIPGYLLKAKFKKEN